MRGKDKLGEPPLPPPLPPKQTNTAQKRRRSATKASPLGGSVKRGRHASPSGGGTRKLLPHCLARHTAERHFDPHLRAGGGSDLVSIC